MKIVTRIIAIVLILILTLSYTISIAEPPAKPDGEAPSSNGGTPPDKPNGETPPDKPDGNGGPQGGENGGDANVSHTGETEISSDTESDGQTYSSTTGSQNALLVTGGTSTLTNPVITKTGDADGDNSDFYGTNAGVLVKEGTLNIKGGNVTTNGAHANGVFAYSKGVINISDTNIRTTNNNSGAVMVTGGGTLTANNVTAETDGNSSAPIRSDRGGGNLTVNGGTYISHGVGSPVIYSTANIVANNAKLTSTASEGVVIEGKNSATLNNVTMEATNTSLNSNSETYKSIFIYQSMSGDAEVGTSSFTAKDSKIINNKGDVIFVTNTSTVIDLENNEITNNDDNGSFMKISSAKWGNEGNNGGNVTLNAKNQKIDGDIVVDSISTLDLNLKNESSYSGMINKEKTAKTVNVTLDSSSTLMLTGDSYISSLKNEVSDNSNINLNGHTLYVNGTAITSTNYDGAKVSSIKTNEPADSKKENSDLKDTIVLSIASFVAIICVVLLIRSITKKENRR